MRYSINNYVEALVGALDDASADKKDKIVANFVKLLEKNGDLSQRDKIIEKVHKKVVNLNGGKWITVELARETTEPKLRLIKESFSKKDHISVKLNPTLTAGVRITIDGEKELDNSLNNKLKKLFK